MNWEILVAAGSIVFTILGVVVPLFIHSDNKTREQLLEARKETTEQIGAIHRTIDAIRQDGLRFQEEMKLIHGRMCTLEERYRRG